jgi:hypothetical protein
VIRKETAVELLRRVEEFLKRSGMTPTRFGRQAVRDPRLVFDMRKGREPHRRLARRIADFIDSEERGTGQ